MAQPVPQTIKQIKEACSAARSTFVGVDDYINLLELGLISGEPMIALGPPGGSKSTVPRYICNVLGLDIFRKNLGKDTRVDELFGAIDLKELQQGRWTRNPAGVATHTIVFMDEIGKASTSVRDMLLDSMEERTVNFGDGDHEIPLHLMISASNETIVEDNPAVWDRFTARVVVNNLTSAGDIVRMIGAQGAVQSPPSNPITRDDIKACRAAVLAIAHKLDDDTKKVISQMLAALKNDIDLNDPLRRISNRRWVRTTRLAAASALKAGRDHIEYQDLNVARYTMWSVPDDIPTINQIVDNLTKVEDTAIDTAKLLLSEIKIQAASAATATARSRVNRRIQSWMKASEKYTGPEWEAMSVEIRDIYAKLNAEADDDQF